MHAVMTMNEPMIRHHDLLIEMGSLEMAMERLAERDHAEQGRLRPRIEQRLARLRADLETLEG
jgi:hypothetical protein